jgi:hypothetical protein
MQGARELRRELLVKELACAALEREGGLFGVEAVVPVVVPAIEDPDEVLP